MTTKEKLLFPAFLNIFKEKEIAIEGKDWLRVAFCNGELQRIEMSLHKCGLRTPHEIREEMAIEERNFNY